MMNYLLLWVPQTELLSWKTCIDQLTVKTLACKQMCSTKAWKIEKLEMKSWIQWRIHGIRKIFFGDRAATLSKGLYDLSPPTPPPSSQGLLFTTQTLAIRHLCCHRLRSHGGHKLEHILLLKVRSRLLSKYSNSHDYSFYWLMFHEPLTLDIFMHIIKSIFLRLTPVQQKILWVFKDLFDNCY